jgi:glutaconate CoA-transferase, subunit A
MRDKTMSLEEFQKEVKGIPEQGMLGIGGQSVNMNPMGLVREILRAGVKDLHVLASPVGGLAVDLLVGAGVVHALEFAQISLWEFGMAPNFRRAAEEGSIKLLEHT